MPPPRLAQHHYPPLEPMFLHLQDQRRLEVASEEVTACRKEAGENHRPAPPRLIVGDKFRIPGLLSVTERTKFCALLSGSLT
jgi:hypothetical protein